jgi:hypothetical protein
MHGATPLPAWSFLLPRHQAKNTTKRQRRGAQHRSTSSSPSHVPTSALVLPSPCSLIIHQQHESRLPSSSSAQSGWPDPPRIPSSSHVPTTRLHAPMRLLRYSESDELSIHSFSDTNIPPYAILSHTWDADGDEVTFADLQTGGGRRKLGYKKILFCGRRARRDNLQYFWVDTCCIDTTHKAEHSQAIQSMFRWYRSATKCYVFLSDVSTNADGISVESSWESAFRLSRWFTRGWTLQELLAPTTVEFFSREGEKLGNKVSLTPLIRKITGISLEVLKGAPLFQYSTNERWRWAECRKTKRDEDRAYCLQGIFGIELAPVYGEGESGAFDRLKHEVSWLERCMEDMHSTNPRDDKKRIEETKGGLLANSYRWVLDNTAFRQWHEDKHSRLL